MGNCKYCGQPVGLFSKAHKECEAKHTQALSEFGSVCNAYFLGNKSSHDIISQRTRLKANNFLTDEDVVKVGDSAMRTYTDSIRRPYTPRQLSLVDEFINALGVSYANLNHAGAVDGFTQKLLKGFMVDFFTDNLSLSAAQSRCQRVISTLPISREGANEAYYYVLNKAAHNFLKDGLISDDEQRKIDEYVTSLALPLNNLPVQLRGSEIEKISQASVLKNFERGILPPKNISTPILLGRNESILWAFNGVSLYEEKIEREWVGRNRGMSFRICRGVYYRTGGSKGHAVEHSSMQQFGIGTLYVTNKNLIFHSMMKATKIPYKKIVGITPYSDGIEIHRDGANVKRMTMQGFDPWFVMNLMSMIAE